MEFPHSSDFPSLFEGAHTFATRCGGCFRLVVRFFDFASWYKLLLEMVIEYHSVDRIIVFRNILKQVETACNFIALLSRNSCCKVLCLVCSIGFES